VPENSARLTDISMGDFRAIDLPDADWAFANAAAEDLHMMRRREFTAGLWSAAA
jgi:hypothetical protein